ncbi:hypothetical protein ZEAMMB73_Zm00001d047706 [Zea mays]|uniref:Uncharacterized protein n=1 Tax=Zea mays TaxID=4577 RepID=A0A1D6PCH5_MAIZE|nr:hypothetical protein ZEAMMB73_Zm00001d047706 [Zea mays]
MDAHRTTRVAAVGGQGNYAISGGVKGIEVVEAKAKFFKARMTVRLALAGALHTSFMQPAVSRLEPALAATEIRTPRIPVISNVDAQPHSDPDTIKLQADFSAAGKVIAGILKRINKGASIENIGA